MDTVTVILLAGGKGKRLGGSIPKQYLPLNKKPLILHSLEILSRLPFVSEIIVVCEEKYRSLFPKLPLLFASPGETRQKSLYHAMEIASSKTSFICTHDAARPFITMDIVNTLFEEAKKHGAATLASKVKYTIKETGASDMVSRTIPRTGLWEIHTPQIIRAELLRKGIKHAKAHDITVTDDVSLIEKLNLPVKLVPSNPENIKITTPIDLAMAKALHEPIQERFLGESNEF